MDVLEVWRDYYSNKFKEDEESKGIAYEDLSGGKDEDEHTQNIRLEKTEEVIKLLWFVKPGEKPYRTIDDKMGWLKYNRMDMG